MGYLELSFENSLILYVKTDFVAKYHNFWGDIKINKLVTRTLCNQWIIISDDELHYKIDNIYYV